MVEPVRLHVQHKAEQRFVPLPAPHRHRVVAVLVDEVGGAVDGVDVPHGFGRGGAHCGVFLAHDGIGGKLAQDALAQKLLRPAVPDGDQVLMAGLAAHRVRLQPGLPQRGAGLAHQRLGQFKPFHISPPFPVCFYIIRPQSRAVCQARPHQITWKRAFSSGPTGLWSRM